MVDTEMLGVVKVYTASAIVHKLILNFNPKYRTSNRNATLSDEFTELRDFHKKVGMISIPS